ncbi:MAG: hypothetical protein ACXAB7_03140 [Candidatus Kariarchaeaceae archaeon]
MSEYTPTFNMESYQKGLIGPAIWLTILQVLWLILSYIDTTDPNGTGDSKIQIIGHGGYYIEIIILFGAWAGISVAKFGGNAGDGFIAGILLGLIGWIVWTILFGYINPVGDSDFADHLLPMLWSWILVNAGGAVAVSGIMNNK